jgi:endo-1,4-beta-xylanase
MRTRPFPARILSAGLVVAGVLVSGGRAPAQDVARREAPLQGAFANDFRVGTTLNLDHVYGRDLGDRALVVHHFNAITPENLLKWESVEPEQGRYAFEAPDRYVAFGEANGMFVVGHTLVWHNQTPGWVFRGPDGQPASRDTLLARMRAHIHTVVGRYRGRIRGWDVVNEALNEDGTLRQSPWMRIIGPDYLALAFRYAHEADPAAELYYNDYSLENPAKRAGAVRLIRALLDQGVPVTAVGMQGHHKLDWPTPAAEDSTIAAFAALGVKVAITELDIDVQPRAGTGAEVTARGPRGCDCSVNPYVAGLPDSVQQALARRYADFFEVYRRHAGVVTRVTFWGVTDRGSWLNDWPIRGRTNHPLLFGWLRETKPAFDAVMRVGQAGRAAAQAPSGGAAPREAAGTWSEGGLQQ